MSPSAVVTFDYTAWIVAFPEFAAVTQPVAQSYFDRVTTGGLVDNSATSIITDLSQRAVLLNLAVSHLAVLAGALNPSQRQTVGRVASASQGSVSASLEYNVKGGLGAAFWNQTSYGAQFYMMTLQFRTAFYNPAPCVLPTVPGGAYARRRW